ncbi:MAG TPA: hypothetical protein VGL99_22735 [Chloroflexota bacterium]|jgi:hypothetical protein
MKFHIKWETPKPRLSAARIRASLILLGITVLALAGSAGQKWSGQ